ncbi:uncharacterized protein LOC116204742 [Punica granatum]|uniref:Uncharacterized protein n=2 Tax=Punica granatum TaxID=22663 RepID=A0A218X4B7_PUNGR|nr:uncharacterized protein LOC116204742 [Punica granatum]OWM79837.1 hypothetical protein CDL15_Pgr023249 [Punica granatum]PKI42378.1 hypothetical protein CRG98_037220 [Punica granatum]
MQPPLSSAKHHASSRLVNIFLILSSMIIVYLLVSMFVVFTSKNVLVYFSEQEPSGQTSLDHVVFGIVSSRNSWPDSKEFVKLWWRPQQMGGCVFLESFPLDWDLYNDTDSLPPLCISGDTSRFRYSHRGGSQWAIRAARAVSEIMALNRSNAQWYVFGDEDTIFFPNNLVKTLSKYDHRLWYYIGASSENFEQNRAFGFGMAFGGAGFAVSSSLAGVLAKVLDSCLERYPHLYGGDSRVYSCIAELGIGMTHEPGFHQFDVRGDAFGLLAAHPVTPLVSIHNLPAIDPIFPNKTTAEALEHFFKAVEADPERILQQTICYDRWFSWTISVSWGYAVQVFPRHLFLPDATQVQETFKPWKGGNVFGESYTLDTRKLHPDPCGRSTIFFFDQVYADHDGIKSTYKKSPDNCPYDATSPKYVEEIRVYSDKLDLSVQQLQAPRRHCCDLLPSSNNKVFDIAIRQCKEEELMYMHL